MVPPTDHSLNTEHTELYLSTKTWQFVFQTNSDKFMETQHTFVMLTRKTNKQKQLQQVKLNHIKYMKTIISNQLNTCTIKEVKEKKKQQKQTNPI
jgi:hypothetical protein